MEQAIRGGGARARNGHREVGVDAGLLAPDRGAGSTCWWGQPQAGRSHRPRRLGGGCESLRWASWDAMGQLGENIVLITFRGVFQGRQVCMGGFMMVLDGLNRQRAFIVN